MIEDTKKAFLLAKTNKDVNIYPDEVISIISKADFKALNGDNKNIAMCVAENNARLKLPSAYLSQLFLSSDLKVTDEYGRNLAEYICSDNDKQKLNLSNSTIFSIIKKSNPFSKKDPQRSVASLIANNNIDEKLYLTKEQLVSIFQKSDLFNKQSFINPVIVDIIRNNQTQKLNLNIEDFKQIFTKNEHLRVMQHGFTFVPYMVQSSVLGHLGISVDEILNFVDFKNNLSFYKQDFKKYMSIKNNLHPINQSANGTNPVFELLNALIEKQEINNENTANLNSAVHKRKFL